jgi:Tfp pilus assembly protein PilF
MIWLVTEADSWLNAIPHPHNRHSFSVGAFIGSQPEFILISNFEDLVGNVAPQAASKLVVYRSRPGRPTTYVSGIVHAVNRAQRRLLAKLASRDLTPSAMYEALANVNRAAARRTDYVSEACFTTHIRLTGDGGGLAHGAEGHVLKPLLGTPPEIQGVIRKLLDEQFGAGRGSIRSISFGRSEASDEYHHTQLREKPKDASVHSNYGAYLKDTKGDVEGAEREYKKALDLDPSHVNALGNLANVYWEQGKNHDAEVLYRRALANQAREPNVTWNFARFLNARGGNYEEIVALLNSAITKHPENGRLRLLLADIHLQHGQPAAALEAYRQARGINNDQAAVERGYAFALQMSGGAIGDCLAAYRLAITLNPHDANLRLNFAQVLFIAGDNNEAIKQVGKALRLGLEPTAEIEAQFYRVCHIESQQEDALARLQALVDGGARLNWNVNVNISLVRVHDPARASQLQQLANALSGTSGDTTGAINRLLKR